MNIIHVIVLAVVEGVTEFLPISSTGHMVLVSHLLGIEQTDFVKSFEIIIQLGAILAAVILYAKMLLANRALLYKVAVSFVPAAVIGLVGYKLIKGFLLGNAWITVVALLLGGIALIVLEYKLKQEKGTKLTLKSITYREALIIGLAQSVSIIPGVSRAAATIMGGLLTGMNRKSAVEFSFMLAIPTMLAASGLDILESRDAIMHGNILYLALGFVIAFAVAYAVIRWMLKFIQTNTLIPFGVYRIILALLFMLFVLR
jgi:undecaprenyl-diphosphatase